METRNLRKTRQGVVISNKMDKTIVIAAKFKEMHPIYGKFVQKTKKYHAHDEKNEANVGDTVLIMELSHTVSLDSACIIFYLAFSTICTNLHLFVFDKGRVSITRTVSPTLASFFSS